MLKRELYLSKIRNFYDSELVKILVGMRRSGKSVILTQIIEELKEKGINENHIIYINFEDYDYLAYTDPLKFNDYIKNKIIDEEKYYLFFDEIQYVKDFEKVVNSFRATMNVSIFITGSNSKLLANELSSVLSGRYVSFRINPLSYKEFVKLTGKEASSQKTLDNYIKWGGLPYRTNFEEEEEIKNYLRSVFNSIIVRDIIEILNLKDSKLLYLIIQYIIDTTGREFSAENIVKVLQKEGQNVSTKTIYKYIDTLCKSLLINKVYRTNVHGRIILKTLNKFYMNDLGIAHIKTNDSEINRSFALENIVYNDLIIKGYDVYIGKTTKGEIDFVAIKDGKPSYIQVVSHLVDEKVIEREFGAFSVLDDNYPKFVISQDRENFSREGIIHKNIIDFLMDNDL